MKKNSYNHSGDDMRVFYIFNINEYFSETYANKSYKLYCMLKDIYLAKEHNSKLVDNYFEQISNQFDIDYINNYLYNILSNNDNYSKKENNHIICDNFECSKLILSTNCIKLKTNQQFPDILKLLANINKYIFVCDFHNNKYFWLNNNIVLT